MTADIFLTSRFGPARSIDLARVAERAGLGGVWLDELRTHYTGPIRVAATSQSTVELAAARGMPLILGVEHDDASAGRMVRQWSAVRAVREAGHCRLVIACPDRADLARWLRGIGDPSRDLGAHLDHLMSTRAGPVPGIGRVIRMVEAAGSIEATAALIEKLESVC